MRLALAALLLCFGCAHAASTSQAPRGGEASSLAASEVVALRVARADRMKAGEHGELELRLRIAPGYHVMSDRPSRPNYIATRIELAAVEGMRFEAPRYPAPQRFTLGSETIATFAGDVSVRIGFAVAREAVPGKRELRLELAYQACTEESCLFPVRRTEHTQLEVVR